MILTSNELRELLELVNTVISSYRLVQPEDCFILSDCAFGSPTTQSRRVELAFGLVLSYFNQVCLRYWRQSHVMRNDAALTSIVEELITNPSTTVIDLAKCNQCSSYKISKHFLERISQYESIVDVSKTKNSLTISEFLQSPEIIIDGRIRLQIINGICEDLLCSPFQEPLKESVGKEYEALLEQKLRRLGITFETEADLRSKGKARTPDILLSIPMIAKYSLIHSNGSVIREVIATAVNWIDSKAMFADSETYAEHRDQFRAYSNRFGHGMVIYWLGFAESLLSQVEDDNVFVTDHFPLDWQFPTGEVADGTLPRFMSINLSEEISSGRETLHRALFDD